MAFSEGKFNSNDNYGSKIEGRKKNGVIKI